MLFDVAVDRNVVTECITLALQAPTGSGVENWTYRCVDDGSMIHELAAIYRRTFTGRHVGNRREGEPQLSREVDTSAWHLVKNFHRCRWSSSRADLDRHRPSPISRRDSEPRSSPRRGA